MSLNLEVAWGSRKQGSFAENKGIRGRVYTASLSQGPAAVPGRTFRHEVQVFFNRSDKPEEFPTERLSQILSSEASESSGTPRTSNSSDPNECGTAESPDMQPRDGHCAVSVVGVVQTRRRVRPTEQEQDAVSESSEGKGAWKCKICEQKGRSSLRLKTTSLV